MGDNDKKLRKRNRYNEDDIIIIKGIIQECDIFRKNVEETLAELSDKHYEMGATQYYDIKSKMYNDLEKRYSSLASGEYSYEFMQRIETLKKVEQCLWDEYHNTEAEDTLARTKVLQLVKDIQKDLALFYMATPTVDGMVKSLENKYGVNLREGPSKHTKELSAE